jgi:hypothetical protein
MLKSNIIINENQYEIEFFKKKAKGLKSHGILEMSSDTTSIFPISLKQGLIHIFGA